MSRRSVGRVIAVLLLVASGADAQPAKRKPEPPTLAPIGTTATNLRAHVGLDQVTRLLRGDADDRIRGVQRAAAIGSPEVVALLAETLERDRGQQLKSDPRALLALARALSPLADQERARAALLVIVSSGTPTASGRLIDGEGDPVARAELARTTAAIALARRGGDRALDALYAVARAGGSGQPAAIAALLLHPPREAGFFGAASTAMPLPVVRMLGQLGDLRALDVLHAAVRSTDVSLRAAALVALAELGDERAGPLARAAIAESDIRLRAASGEAFVVLGAPERFKATAAIVSDDATTSIGLRMAERTFSPEITKLVAARAREHPDREIRLAAIRALGRSPDPEAAKALVMPTLLGDREFAYLAVSALARSPAPNAGALLGGLFATRLVGLATRAYVVRAIVRGERTRASDEAAFRLAQSRIPTERALGVFAKVALGDSDVVDFLEDKDPRTRRAAVMGSLAHERTDAVTKRLLERLAHEDDAVTRQVLGVALLSGDSGGIVKTSILADRAESGGGDAPAAALAFARRADETTARKIGQLLASRDPVLRAHVARGLGRSPLPDATGRLAEVYRWETDVDVRRAVIAALAARPRDRSAPLWKETLSLAADLDPDGAVRRGARLALEGSVAPFAESSTKEVAFLRLSRDGGQAPGEPFVGALVGPDGLATPIVFDEEGFAVVPGLPPGESRLMLAPRLPTDKASTP